MGTGQCWCLLKQCPQKPPQILTAAIQPHLTPDRQYRPWHPPPSRGSDSHDQKPAGRAREERPTVKDKIFFALEACGEMPAKLPKMSWPQTHPKPHCFSHTCPQIYRAAWIWGTHDWGRHLTMDTKVTSPRQSCLKAEGGGHCQPLFKWKFPRGQFLHPNRGVDSSTTANLLNTY